MFRTLLLGNQNEVKYFSKNGIGVLCGLPLATVCLAAATAAVANLSAEISSCYLELSASPSVCMFDWLAILD